MGGGASRWKRAAQNFKFPCACLFDNGDPLSHQNKSTILSSAIPKCSIVSERISGEEHSTFPAKQILCAICLEPLNEGDSCSSSRKIFTSECHHSFHLACIASNVRHGSTACPICRIHWRRLPRDLLVAASPPELASADPILRILDDSIATSRVNRRSSLRSVRYDDDDPTEPIPARHARLRLSLSRSFSGCSSSSSLSIRLAPRSPVDLVLVASPDGSHLRLLKQAVALTVFSLGPTDRFALVTCSPAAATRVFALRRMSSHGKRAALQAIDRLSHIAEADPAIGLRKAARILEDRAHRNPLSCLLHLSENPNSSADERLALQVQWFHVGFVMHKFEEFLGRVLGEEVRDVRLRIGKEGGDVRIGDLRCGEERRIPADLSGGDADSVCVSYEYKECAGGMETAVDGDAVVKIGGKGDRSGDDNEDGGGEGAAGRAGPRRSCAERWDYVDPFMARRWAKHLHACRT